mgnify:CR=1 FL=1
MLGTFNLTEKDNRMNKEILGHSLEYLKTLSVPFFYCGKLPKDMINKNMIEIYCRLNLKLNPALVLAVGNELEVCGVVLIQS